MSGVGAGTECPKRVRPSGQPGILGESKTERTDVVSRLLVMTSAAICVAAIWVAGGPVAHAQPVGACGPDQAAAIDSVLRHEFREPTTGRPFSPRPIGGNYDPCANMSAILMTVDGPLPVPQPVQAMFFHRGTYMGKATMYSYPGTTLNAEASTKDTVVLDFQFGENRRSARYHWDGFRVATPDPMPPQQLLN